MKYAFIGTYPPRECGIGTFTHNLLDSVIHSKKAEKGNFEGFVVAVNDHDLKAGAPERLFKSCKVYQFKWCGYMYPST
jgi:hypothetical protein